MTRAAGPRARRMPLAGRGAEVAEGARRWAAPVLWSLVAHAALFAWLQPGGWKRSGAGHETPATSARSLDLRLPRPVGAGALRVRREAPAPRASPGRSMLGAPSNSVEAAAPASPGSPLADYVAGAVLSRGPSPLDEPRFALPEGRESGRVVLRLLVSERGEVDAVSVLASELPAPAADAVGAAFRALRFSPGEWFGEPVKSRLDVEVTVAAD